MYLSIEFSNSTVLKVNLAPTPLGADYQRLVHSNYNEKFPTYRDKIKYDSEYLLTLALQAKTAFGWDWDLPEYNLSVTPSLHRDLERLLGQTGFSNVPEEYDNLLHELHYCLHIVQHPDLVHTRIGQLQIEWFNDTGFMLPADFEFSTQIKFGDCLLQNPYVGHGPVQINNENDWESLDQVCKFHTFVKPGIVIYTGPNFEIDRNRILDKFKQHNPAFVKKHTEETILYYTGFPTIGQVENVHDLTQLVNDPLPINLTKIEFCHD
jgi:hypothetical protein